MRRRTPSSARRARTRAVPNQATGRQRPRGQAAVREQQRDPDADAGRSRRRLSQSSSHMRPPARVARCVVRQWPRPALLSENRIAIASSSQPIALPGCRLGDQRADDGEAGQRRRDDRARTCPVSPVTSAERDDATRPRQTPNTTPRAAASSLAPQPQRHVRGLDRVLHDAAQVGAQRLEVELVAQPRRRTPRACARRRSGGGRSGGRPRPGCARAPAGRAPRPRASRPRPRSPSGRPRARSAAPAPR